MVETVSSDESDVEVGSRVGVGWLDVSGCGLTNFDIVMGDEVVPQGVSIGGKIATGFRHSRE